MIDLKTWVQNKGRPSLDGVRTAALLVLTTGAIAGCSPPSSSDNVEQDAQPSVAEPQQRPVPGEAPEEAPQPVDGDAFGPARAAIDTFCDGDAACVQEQRKEMAYFVNMMAAFEDRDRAVAESCLRTGMVDGGVDWTIVTPCMRDAVKGKMIGDSIN